MDFKRIWFLILIIQFLPFVLSAQALLESADGEELIHNPIGITGSSLIGGFNFSEQSAQFKTTFVLPHKSILPDQYFSFGLKSKPTNGVASIFKDGKIDVGTNIHLGYTKMNVFSGMMSNFTDYFTIKTNLSVNKYTIFNPNIDFNNQLQNINFTGFGLSGNYNNLVSGKNLFTISVGYLFKNNFSSLPTIELRDFQTIFDETSQTERQYGNTINVRKGEFKKYHSIPYHLAYTFTPSEFKDEADEVKFGFSAYYQAELSSYKSAHNVGVLLFLTKLNIQSGVRIPMIGFGIQANDITGNLSSQKRFKERVAFNLTTAFNIASL